MLVLGHLGCLQDQGRVGGGISRLVLGHRWKDQYKYKMIIGFRCIVGQVFEQWFELLNSISSRGILL